MTIDKVLFNVWKIINRRRKKIHQLGISWIFKLHPKDEILELKRAHSCLFAKKTRPPLWNTKNSDKTFTQNAKVSVFIIIKKILRK